MGIVPPDLIGSVDTNYNVVDFLYVSWMWVARLECVLLYTPDKATTLLLYPNISNA